MKTEFDVDQEIAIKGKIVNIEIDETGIYYDVELIACTSVRTFTFKENQLFDIVREFDGNKTRRDNEKCQ